MITRFSPFLKTCVKHAIWAALALRHGRRHAPLRVRRGPAAGTVLLLDVRSQGAYWLGNYDSWVLARVPVARFLTAGQTAWDCGSFVGYYAAIFRACVGASGEVVAFEASGNNFRQISRVAALNGWGNLAARHHAVGPDHTTLRFAGNLGGASGPSELGREFSQTGIVLESVQSCGVDELVHELNVPAPDFIKFDLETGEIAALHNGPRVFREKRPVLLLELHGAEAMAAAGAFLETYGYAAALIERLPEFAGLSTQAWDEAYARIAMRSLSDLKAIGYLPHMVFCLPQERCARIEAEAHASQP